MGKIWLYNKYEEILAKDRRKLLKECFVRADGVTQCPSKHCIGYGIKDTVCPENDFR